MPTLGAKDYSCAVSSYGQVFTDPWEKFFFFSPLRRSWRRPATDTEPSNPATSEKKISGTQGKQAVQLAETGQGRLALTTNKRFEISAFISSHVEQFISSTQADKIQFLSSKLTRASWFSFVSLFNRHVFSCRHCCHNNRVTSARWVWHQIRSGFGSHWTCVLEPPSARRPSVLWEMQVRRTKVP